MDPREQAGTGEGGDDGGASGVEPGRLYESTRVEAFSDGVLAIAITLLVLDLSSRSSPGHVLSSLLRQWPAYLAYLASFGFIGVIWVNHHQLFTRVTAVDTGLLWRNLALLLTVSVLPFPTAVLSTAFQHGNPGDEKTASVFYGVAGGVTAAAWLALYHYLSRNERLLTRRALAAFFASASPPGVARRRQLFPGRSDRARGTGRKPGDLLRPAGVLRRHQRGLARPLAPPQVAFFVRRVHAMMLPDHIPPVTQERWSMTFRTLRRAAAGPGDPVAVDRGRPAGARPP